MGKHPFNVHIPVVAAVKTPFIQICQNLPTANFFARIEAKFTGASKLLQTFPGSNLLPHPNLFALLRPKPGGGGQGTGRASGPNLAILFFERSEMIKNRSLCVSVLIFF